MPSDLDHEVLEQLVRDLDDRSIVQAVVQTYLEALDPRVEAVEVALAAGDRHGVDATAHALASASVLVGLTTLTAAGRAVEHAAADGDLPLAAARMEALRTAVAGARVALHRWLGAA